jgi:outer membrane protein assembly factor BamE
LLLAGCAGYIPFAYEVEVQQGNIITDEMISQLRPGMSREQVRYVLGTPAIEAPFHADRWDYVYAIDRENEPMEVERLTVRFRDDRLASLEGSLAPAGFGGS